MRDHGNIFRESCNIVELGIINVFKKAVTFFRLIFKVLSMCSREMVTLLAGYRRRIVNVFKKERIFFHLIFKVFPTCSRKL